jgi:molybdate transport system substrate-binding protein
MMSRGPSRRYSTVREVIAVIVAAAVLALVPQLGWCEELVVSAAVSLSNAFKELGGDFEREHADVKVLFNFGASGQLLQQIAHGAPVDVFASADQETMDRAEAQQLILAGTRSNFVRNRLVLIVPGGATSTVSSVEELKRPTVTRIAIGKPDSVPAGRYAQEALELAGLWETLKPKYIYGQNVRQVLDYVERGEVDAGFVYATDAVVAANKVRVVTEASVQRPILYPVAVVATSANPARAREFAAFLLSESAQKTLSRYAFAKP